MYLGAAFFMLQGIGASMMYGIERGDMTVRSLGVSAAAMFSVLMFNRGSWSWAQMVSISLAAWLLAVGTGQLILRYKGQPFEIPGCLALLFCGAVFMCIGLHV
jgi:hypothetical protein